MMLTPYRMAMFYEKFMVDNDSGWIKHNNMVFTLKENLNGDVLKHEQILITAMQ